LRHRNARIALTRRGFGATIVSLAAAAALPRPAAAQAAATVRAAITPVYYDKVPILYAQHAGMLAKAGIDVQLGRLPTGAAITAAVAGGSLDIGKSSFHSVVAAVAHGVPVVAIAPGAVYDSRSPNGALVVGKDSPIPPGRPCSCGCSGTIRTRTRSSSSRFRWRQCRRRWIPTGSTR
jgi:ABC-type nitrate/sulfonate/bicarbonate transport system substrate-binding protein